MRNSSVLSWYLAGPVCQWLSLCFGELSTSLTRQTEERPQPQALRTRPLCLCLPIHAGLWLRCALISLQQPFVGTEQSLLWKNSWQRGETCVLSTLRNDKCSSRGGNKLGGRTDTILQCPRKSKKFPKSCDIWDNMKQCFHGRKGRWPEN